MKLNWKLRRDKQTWDMLGSSSLFPTSEQPTGLGLVRPWFVKLKLEILIWILSDDSDAHAFVKFAMVNEANHDRIKSELAPSQ